MRWLGSLLAWATPAGVYLYDVAAHARVALLPRPPSAAPSEAPHLAWDGCGGGACLAVGWGCEVRLATVRSRPPRPDEALAALDRTGDDAAAPLAVRSAEMDGAWACECPVRGLARAPGRRLLLLACPPRGPELRCVEAATGEEATVDAVPLRGWAAVTMAQPAGPPAAAPAAPAAAAAPAPCPPLLLLASSPGWAPPTPLPFQPRSGAAFYPPGWTGGGPSFVLATQQDLVAARPRDLKAHCAWLTARGRHAAALAAAEAAVAAGWPGSGAAAAAAGRAWLRSLLARGSPGATAAAAALCPRALRGDGCGWEGAVYDFASVCGLPSLAPYLPLTLPPGAYAMCLAACAASSLPAHHALLGRLVRAWPPHLAAPADVAAALAGRVDGDPAAAPPSLVAALAAALLACGRPDEAAQRLLDAGHPDALPLLQAHSLAALAVRRLGDVARLDHAAAAAWLVEERGGGALQPAAVVAALARLPGAPPGALLGAYLRELLAADPGSFAPHAALCVRLTGAHAPAQLLPLLASPFPLPLDEALAAARACGHVAAQVAVLGRLGDAAGALALILDTAPDAKAALDFVARQADPRLWAELVARAAASPQLAAQLLPVVGSHADGRPLLRALHPTSPLQGLRAALATLLRDTRAQAELWADCGRAARGECDRAQAQLHAANTRARPRAAVRLLRPG